MAEHQPISPNPGEETHADSLVERLETLIIREYGVVLTGRSLMRVLGYRSLEALRQAIYRGTVPIPVFPMENRRGKGALASDAAKWLSSQRAKAVIPK
jgi:hypothetical protein